MEYILLPGLSKQNYKWSQLMKGALKNKGINLTIVDWTHWKEEKEGFNFMHEYNRVINLIKAKEVVIIAKSVGTRLIAEIIKNNSVDFNLKFLVLLGIPSKNEVYKELLNRVDAKRTVLFQNERDPLLSYEDLEIFIHESNRAIKIIKGERSDHNYPYPELIFSVIYDSLVKS